MLFVHGHQFIKHENRYYTSGSLNNKLFERYINIFGAVTVFANQKEVTENDLKHIDDQNKVDNVHLKLMHNKNNIFEIIKNRNKVKEAVAENKYIIIRMPSFYGVLAAMYAQKSNKKYLIELVGCPWDAYWNHSLKGKMIAPLMWLATKIVVRNAQYVLYVTSEFLQNRYPTKGVNIGCSDVHIPSTDDVILYNRERKINNLNISNVIKIGTLASVDVKYKGQEYVIKAISLLNSQGYNFEYFLAGPGDTSYLESIADKFGVSDKIKFCGKIPPNKIFDFLDEIDIYIQPSTTEGLPRALIEAMSRGCPSFGSNVGGIPELLTVDSLFEAKSSDQISSILMNINRNELLKNSRYCFKTAKKYDNLVLNSNRNTFYTEYFLQD